MENALASYQLGSNNSPVVTKPQGPALVAIESQRAMTEVQGAIIMARQFPRDQIAAMDRIIVSCQRPGLADQALYSYARGGSEVTGPSIRLAEAIAQNWGNLQYGIKELEQRGGESTVEAFAWDMETNVRQVKIFQVKHERFTKKGSYKLEDPRDIYELTANQGARRLRACILGIIPGDVIDAAVSQCEATQKSKADTSPEALKKLTDAFMVYGVTKDQIEKRIQRRLDTITPAQLVSLRKVYNSLKDNMSSAADWFDMGPAEPGKTTGEPPADLKEKIRQKKTAAAPAPVENDVPEPPPVEYAPDECPDMPGTIPMKAYCDANKCKKREGCPVWGGR